MGWNDQIVPSHIFRVTGSFHMNSFSFDDKASRVLFELRKNIIFDMFEFEGHESSPNVSGVEECEVLLVLGTLLVP